MATTAIDKNRNSAAMQRYNDAVFMRDDKYLYFGNDGDESIHYDSVSDALVISTITLADSTFLYFGTNKDFSMGYDATSDALVLLTVTSDNPAILGGMYYTVISDARCLCVSSG